MVCLVGDRLHFVIGIEVIEFARSGIALAARCSVISARGRLYLRFWMKLPHQGIFQLYYYGDAMGVDKNAREIYRGHKWFDGCEKFCVRWDQMSFDPDYSSYTLAHFTPMVREIFSRPPFDPGIVIDEL